MRRTVLFTLALLGLLGAAAGGWYVLQIRNENAAAGGGGRPAGRGVGGGGAPVPVTVAPATRQDVPIDLDALGTVQAFATVTVRAQVDGQLTEIAFREGQEVRQGDVLARIDPRLYQAALNQALARKAQDEALLANARLDLQRYAQLARNEGVSRQQQDTQRAQVAQYEAQIQADQAAIDTTRTQLGYTTIRAPIDGRVGLRLVDPGNLVRAGDATGIVSLAQLRPITVVFTLPQQEIGRVLEAIGRGEVPVEVRMQSSIGRASGIISSAAAAMANSAPCQPNRPIAAPDSGTTRNWPKDEPAVPAPTARLRSDSGNWRVSEAMITGIPAADTAIPITSPAKKVNSGSPSASAMPRMPTA